jgi:choice-of-anchor A domain-containing protein
MKSLLFLALILGIAFAGGDGDDGDVPSPPPQTECPAPTPVAPKCRYYTPKLDFGVASYFNVFVHHDFTCSGSDVEGRLAVGGNLNLGGGFDVGCKTYSTNGNCNDVSCTAIALVNDFIYALVVGGNAVYPSGQIHSGGAIVGGTLTGNPTVTGGNCGVVQANAPPPFDFDATFADLVVTAGLLNALPSTGKVTIDSGNNVLFSGTNAGLEVFRISASVLANAKGISFDLTTINPLASIIINVDGTTITASSFGFNTQGLERNTLWNFWEATSISLSSLGWRGTIFAPLADIVTYTGGVIYGQVIANSYTGAQYGCFQINFYEFRGCVPDVPPVPTPPPNTCTHPFGPIASDYNVFVLEDYVCSNSDCEGRVAAGGNIYASNWACGCKIFPPTSGDCINFGSHTCADLTSAGETTDTLVAGISINLVNSEVMVGDLVYGFEFNEQSSSIVSDCKSIQSTTHIDFGAALSYLVCLSETLAAEASTGIYTNDYNQLVFFGSGAAVEVFNIAGFLLSSAVSVEFKNINAGATVIVNVNGGNLPIGNFGFLGSLQDEYLLWNFFEATTLRFYSVAFHGAILAPKATIVDSTGVLIGQIFAQAWNQGTQCMQQNYVQFKGCLPDCTKNPLPPTVGCADGQREGFTDQTKYPCIAACATAWSVPGVVGKTPTCNRQAGDDFPTQTPGCSVEDACANGWHVCASQEEVQNAFNNGGSCTDAGAGFYITQVSGPGCGECAFAAGTNPNCDGGDCLKDCSPNSETRNDLFGCGTLTDDEGEPAQAVPDAATCAPFNIFSNNLCSSVPGLDCGTDGEAEADNAVKPSATVGGGVLCCIDECKDYYSETPVVGGNVSE